MIPVPDLVKKTQLFSALRGKTQGELAQSVDRPQSTFHGYLYRAQPALPEEVLEKLSSQLAIYLSVNESEARALWVTALENEFANKLTQRRQLPTLPQLLATQPNSAKLAVEINHSLGMVDWNHDDPPQTTARVGDKFQLRLTGHRRDFHQVLLLLETVSGYHIGWPPSQGSTLLKFSEHLFPERSSYRFSAPGGVHVFHALLTCNSRPLRVLDISRSLVPLLADEMRCLVEDLVDPTVTTRWSVAHTSIAVS